MAFILWTAAVSFIDVQPIGPENSRVGFASLNQFVHQLTGVHMGLYMLTDWLSLIPLGFVAGLLILLIGQISPLCFMIAFLPLTLVNSGLRPFNTNILLNQYDTDTGSIAGVINFFHMAAGSIGTLVATSIPLNYVTVIGILSLCCSLVSLGLAGYLKIAKVPIKSLQ